MLYFAFGSNLQKVGMRRRCPAAVALIRASLPDHRLVFRHWADVEPAAGSRVSGGLWRITPACLAALDDYEEIATGLYRRVTLGVATPSGVVVEALVYRMWTTTRAPPAPDYLADVVEGCRDFGIDPQPTFDAAEAARV